MLCAQRRSISPVFSFTLLVMLAACSAATPPQASAIAPNATTGAGQQPVLGARAKPVITRNGLHFRDLNGDGALNPYEDWRMSPKERADDLVGRMSLAEKAGTMMHSTLPGENGELGRSEGGYDMAALAPLIRDKHVTSFITRLSLPPARMADASNAVQETAEGTRLGIPVTISTDPRHHFQNVLGAGEHTAGFSQWPEQLGFAALRDPRAVRRFADIARREYRAVGIHMALSPQIDLATEPRWPRATGTFGSDAGLASALGGAYVAGFQGGEGGLQADGVMTVAKHWVGYGASVDGFDGHNYYGRFAQFGDGKLQAHIDAFDGALAAQTGGIMPTYPILKDAVIDGAPVEQVGAGYSPQLLGELLREKLGFEGVILSDWAITRDCSEACRAPSADNPQRAQDIATPWGVEDLTVAERYVKGVKAGLDQFGGVDDIEPLVHAVETGALSQARIDQSVRRILIPKFQMGLFENPYVDPDEAQAVVGAAQFTQEAAAAQRASQVLLENRDGFLPVTEARRRVYLFGVDPQAARDAGLRVVDDPAEADFAIIRAEAPSEMLHPFHFFGSRQKEGRLDFRDGDPAYEALKETSAHAPTVFAIFLDRPAILTNVRDKADAILANFGASDAAVLDVVLGEAKARGKLPFELPASMEAVAAQDPAVADDSASPLYPYGAGIMLP